MDKKQLEHLKKEYEYSKTLSMEDFDKRYIDEKEDWSGFYLPSHEYFLEKFLYKGNDLKPNKNCNVCDYDNDYICFDCESSQVKPNRKEK